MMDYIYLVLFAVGLHYVMEYTTLDGPCPTYCEIDHKCNIKKESIYEKSNEESFTEEEKESFKEENNN